MLRKQKGQGMTEFALILPLLLLLLLGIIEAARVMWSYITVQQAAREAARYAVTGRPFLNMDIGNTDEVNTSICRGQDTEPDPFAPATQPWLCEPGFRVDAIKKAALERGRTLNVSTECDTPGEFFGACASTPGAFGVLVQGQTITGTQVISGVEKPIIGVLNDHPGTQGLNVQVSTFYNVEMITPVYKVVMGDNFLTLRGSAQMQNEGLDAAIGIEPPPPIEAINPTDPGDGVPVVSRKILSLSGNVLEPFDDLQVLLQDHEPNRQFDIYLQNFNGVDPPILICAAVMTDGDGQAMATCDLSSVPAAEDPGIMYTLYSAQVSTTAPAMATANDPITMIISSDPAIHFVELGGQKVWAAGEKPKMRLVAHGTGNYNVYLFDHDMNFLQTVAVGVAGTSTSFDWDQPIIDVVNDAGRPACDLESDAPCYIRSYSGGYSPDPDNFVGQTEIYINQPSIELRPEQAFYQQGETLRVFLRGHTPGKSYEIKIPDGPFGEVSLGSTLGANASGDSSFPVPFTIPAACGGSGGWPDDFYEITSNLPPDDPNAGAQIANKPNVKIQTNPNPYLLIDGGTTHAIGALINIKLQNHMPNTTHYLEFDGQRVPTSNPGNTFNTGACGSATVGYTIPLDTVPGTYMVRSYINAGQVFQAEIEVTVTSKPIIQVVQGNKVLPNETITIRLLNHQPNNGYKVVYAQKVLFEIQTDGSGFRQQNYNLANLPKTPGPDLSNPVNYGKFFDLSSVETESNEIAATTQLALQGADLRVTKIEFPPANQIQINTTIPVTVTVQNIQTVPIKSYFDNDLYLNPSPINPSYYKGYNFPGDAKHWRNSVGAAGQITSTFIITDTVFVGNYGLQTVHAFADTSNFVLEGETANQAGNPNNLLANSFMVACTPPQVSELFGAAPAGWATKRYGNANTGSGPGVSGGRLTIQSNGSSTFVSDDSSGGELLFHRTAPVISTTIGFEVVVQVINISEVGNNSKGGIEIRNSIDNTTSPRVVLGLTRLQNGSSNFVVQPAYRDGGGMFWAPPDSSYFQNNHRIRFSNGPVWLRIERAAGGDTFNYYYKQTTQTPPTNPAAKAAWWGSPVSSIDVPGMTDQLYIGLFNSSSVNNTNSTSTFDNFSFTNPGACEAAQGDPEDEIVPPGLTLCSDPLVDKGFELSPTRWRLAFEEGVARSPGSAHGGLFKVLAASDVGFPVNPWFYQGFIMQDFVISTTAAFQLEVSRNIFNMGSNQSGDQFYAIITTNPSSIQNAINTRITTPTVVAQGVMPSGPYNPSQWDTIKVALPIINRSTIENYKNQPLYLYFYNNSNDTGACGGGGCATEFNFDDISLSPCSTQPLPPNIQTRIKGDLTLHFSGGSTQKLPYVKVWAYTPGNSTIYETMTLPNGEFNFYNLPATTAGTNYVIFSQYHLVDAFDPTQIETLATQTSAILKLNLHTNTTPQRVFLDLFTLDPAP